MPAFIIDNLEAVPEALRTEYEPADGGKFRLKVDGLDAAYVPRSALKTANDEAATRRHQLSAWEKLGKTPDEIAAMLAELDTDKTNKLKNKGDFEALLKQHTDKHTLEKSTLEKRLEGANGAARTAIVDASVTTALTKAKATQEGVDLLVERLGKRINLEIGDDGKRSIQILQADGKTPMAGSGSDGLATFDDLVKEAVKSWPSLFQGTGAGGGGASNTGGGGAANTITRKEWEALAPADRIAKSKAKVKIVD